MQNVCRTCKYAKEKGWNSCYCVKYGIIIGYSKTHCISHEYERGQYVEQAREEAEKIVRKLSFSWWKEHPEYKEQLKWNPFSWSDNKKFKLIAITSVKGETPEKRRVFCEIRKDMEIVFEKIAEDEMERRRKNRSE